MNTNNPTSLKAAGLIIAFGVTMLFTRSFFFPITFDLLEGGDMVMAEAVAANLTGQQLSHAWALFSYPLILLGLLKFNDARKAETKPGLGSLPLFTMLLATFFFSIALVLDGFGTAMVVENFLNLPTTTADPAFMLYSYTHQLALRFFAPNLLLYFFTIGLLGRWTWNQAVFSRWFSILIGAMALIGYPFGVFGYLWENFAISGILSTLGMIWFISLGIFIYRYKTTNKI